MCNSALACSPRLIASWVLESLSYLPLGPESPLNTASQLLWLLTHLSSASGTLLFHSFSCGDPQTKAWPSGLIIDWWSAWIPVTPVYLPQGAIYLFFEIFVSRYLPTWSICLFPLCIFKFPSFKVLALYSLLRLLLLKQFLMSSISTLDGRVIINFGHIFLQGKVWALREWNLTFFFLLIVPWTNSIYQR